jgi:hypothetical protein
VLIGREALETSVSPAQKRLNPPPVPAIPTVTRTPACWIWNSSATASEMGATVLDPSTCTAPDRVASELSPSPPPHGNFAEMPTVYRGPYEYGHPERETDFWPQHEPPAKAEA